MIVITILHVVTVSAVMVTCWHSNDTDNNKTIMTIMMAVTGSDMSLDMICLDNQMFNGDNKPIDRRV